MPDMSASADLALTQLVPLAKEVDENKVTPGVLGFIVFAVMAVRGVGADEVDEPAHGQGRLRGAPRSARAAGEQSSAAPPPPPRPTGRRRPNGREAP